MSLSEDIWQLVKTVERLPKEDQDKILRMVDLLALVPPTVQDRTQRMLRDLLARSPESKSDCVAGLDDVIGYLERHALFDSRLGTLRSQKHLVSVPKLVS